jgi:hypothetical protein
LDVVGGGDKKLCLKQKVMAQKEDPDKPMFTEFCKTVLQVHYRQLHTRKCAYSVSVISQGRNMVQQGEGSLRVLCHSLHLNFFLLFGYVENASFNKSPLFISQRIRLEEKS